MKPGSMGNSKLPSALHSLAAIGKFLAVAKMNPEFYAKHQHAIEFTNALTRQLVGSYPTVEGAFRAALSASLNDGAKGLQQSLFAVQFTETDLRWFDFQMTEVLRMLVPVVRDSELPKQLRQNKVSNIVPMFCS